MKFKLPSIETAQGDVFQNTRVCSRRFKAIAWALENYPDGLVFDEIRREYRHLCTLQGVAHPYDDELEFRNSLTRHLTITLNICRAMNWLTFSIEWLGPPFPPAASGLTPPARIAVHRWKLTAAGQRANVWPERKLKRAIALYLLRFGLTPLVMKLRVPLALASGAVGVAKLILNWGSVHSAVEAVVVIAGAVVLGLIHPHPAVTSEPAAP